MKRQHGDCDTDDEIGNKDHPTIGSSEITAEGADAGDSNAALAVSAPMAAPAPVTKPTLLIALCPILLVAHLFQPVDRLAVDLFLDGDMRHGSGLSWKVVNRLT
jgi:hypothetical protein